MIVAIIIAAIVMWILTLMWFRARSREQSERLRQQSRKVDEFTLDVGGAARRFHVLRTGANPPNGKSFPVIFGLHGGRGSSGRFARASRLPDAAAKAGVALVMPEALGETWIDGRDLDVANLRQDVTFFEKILAFLEKDATLDLARVGVVGQSSGGMMAMRLAIECPDRLAAIVPVNASLPRGYTDLAPDGPGIPLLLVNGTDDKLIPLHGGQMPSVGGLVSSLGHLLPRDETVAYWKRRNRVDAEPTHRELRMAKTTVEVSAYPASDEAQEVCVLTIVDGKHTWPAFDPDGETQLETLAVEFCKRHINSPVATGSGHTHSR